MIQNIGKKLKTMAVLGLLICPSVSLAHETGTLHPHEAFAQNTATDTDTALGTATDTASDTDTDTALGTFESQMVSAPDAPVWEALPDNTHWLMRLFGLGTAPQTTIAPANSVGRDVNQLYALISWIGVGVFAFLLFLFVLVTLPRKYQFSLWHFGKNKHAAAEDTGHSPVWFELIWLIIPIVILIVILIPTMRLTFQIGTPPAIEAEQSLTFFHNNELEIQDRYLEVTVVGHQWWWEFEYEGWHVKQDGQPKFIPIQRVNANEPWLPVGVPIKLNLISEDVIHSFWLPRLAGKIDVVPGHMNTLSFIIEQEGYYWGQCAEYCGASHALMRFHTIGINEADFNAWLNWGQGEVVVNSESARRGQEYVQTCLGCHTMNGMRPFERRQTRIQRDLATYEQNLETYLGIIESWDAQRTAELGTHFRRVILEQPDRPNLPPKPKLHKGVYQTIAPDLTDLRFKRRMFAGIQDNTRENLKRWIENPAAIKPEMQNTKRVNMPAYHGIFDEQMIEDTIEFLRTVEYSESVAPEQLTLWREQ